MQPERGIRQGCPLSPYRFILCAEAFSAMILRAKSIDFIHGIKVAWTAPSISHLFLADDSLIFIQASADECSWLKEIFRAYEKASGQVINFGKSSLAFSLNTPTSRRNEIQSIFNIELVACHEKYLGLPWWDKTKGKFLAL